MFLLLPPRMCSVLNATSSLEIKSVESLKYINDGKPYVKKFTFDAVLTSVDVYTVKLKLL